MKKVWLFPFLLTIASPFALAQVRGPVELVGDIWQIVLSFGQLQFLGLQSEAVVSGITRLLLWLLIFTIIYAVTRWDNRTIRDSVIGHLTRGQATVVAFVIATIAAIFLPVQVLLAVGAGWGTIVSLILIGGPLLGVGIFLWTNPNTPGWIILKIVTCILLLWILEVMKYWLGVLA